MCEEAIRRTLKLLRAKPPERDGERRAQTAAAALMVECARIDHDFSDAERSAIATAAREMFDLDQDVAEMLVEIGEKRADEVWHDWLFAEAIKQGFSEEERRSLIERLRDVAHADGVLRPREAEFIERMSRELGVEGNGSA